MRWTWDDLGRYLAGIAVCVALGWLGFVTGDRVPLLGLFDLGIHELGHLLAWPFPQFVTILAGSALQIAVPLGLSAYFFAIRRDAVAGAVTLAWAGTSARDVSVYAADAPYQALPLIYPNAIHDWAWLLGPEGLDMLGSAAAVSRAIAVAGGLAVVAAIALLAHGAWARQAGPATAPRWFADRPVVERAATRHPVPDAAAEFRPHRSG